MIQFILGAIGVVALSEISKKGKMPMMAKGGSVKQVDLFEHFDKMPKKLLSIVNMYMDSEDYQETEAFLNAVESVGYTFDYGLDNEPFALRPIGVKLNEVEGYEEYKKGGEIDGHYEVRIKERKETRTLADFGTKKDAEIFVYDYSLKHPLAKLSIKAKYAKGGGVGKKEMTLYKIERISKKDRDVLIDRENNIYIYENGVLYDSEDGYKKGASHRMSKINLTILPFAKYAKGGGVGIETKYDLKGWRKSQNKWVVINKNPMSYEEAQEMFESARKSGLYDTLSIESNMLKKPKYATFSVN